MVLDVQIYLFYWLNKVVENLRIYNIFFFLQVMHCIYMLEDCFRYFKIKVLRNLTDIIYFLSAKKTYYSPKVRIEEKNKRKREERRDNNQKENKKEKKKPKGQDLTSLMLKPCLQIIYIFLKGKSYL